jgi:site-specific recombinase XerD
MLALRPFYKFLRKLNVVNDETLEYTMDFKSDVRSIESKVGNYLSLPELDNVIKQATLVGCGLNPFKFKTLLYFVYFTGLRPQELLNLKRESINLLTGTIILPDRQVYFPEILRDTMEQYFKSDTEQSNAFNIDNNDLLRLTATLNRYIVRRRKLSYSFIRDSFANLLVKKTKNLCLVQKLMGYKDMKRVRKYAISDKEAQRIYKRKIKFKGDEING